MGYVTECNENKRLNLECFGDRVPSQKEGSLTLFRSAAALGIILSSKVTAAGLLKFLRDGEMGFGWRAMGKDTRQRLAAVSGHVAAWAAPAGLAQLIVVKLQQRAREQGQAPLRLVLSALGLEIPCSSTVCGKTLCLLIYPVCRALGSPILEILLLNNWKHVQTLGGLQMSPPALLAASNCRRKARLNAPFCLDA